MHVTPQQRPADADGDGDEEASIGGVFDEILRQYANQCEWMVTRLVSGAADAIKPLLEDYRTKERCGARGLW
jgi:hypothetical protein